MSSNGIRMRTMGADVLRRQDIGIPMLLVTVLLALNLIANSVTVRLNVASVALFAVLQLTVLVLGVYGAWRLRWRGPIPWALGIWGLMLTMELVRAAFYPGRYVQSLTDYALYVSPILFLLFFAVCRPSRNALSFTILILVGSGLAGALLGWGFAETTRFQSPAIIAIVGSLVATGKFRESVTGVRPERIRVAGFLASGAILVFILLSRFRTSLVVWIVAGLLALLLQERATKRMATLLAGVAVVVVAAVGVLQPSIPSAAIGAVLEQSRVSSLIDGGGDESTNARVDEVRDVAAAMREDGHVLEYIVGRGHASTYQPERSYIEANVDVVTGRVHNIHVTAVAVWYRYGWIGLGSYLWWIGACVYYAARAVRANPDFPTVTLCVSLVAYLGDMLVRNSFADPLFAFVVAALFFLGGSREEVTPRAT